MAIKNLLGKKFGRLTVIQLAPEVMLEKKKMNDRAAYWHCICDCGNKTITRASHLIRDKAKSCGCLAKERVSETHTKDFGISNINDLLKNYKQAAKRKNLIFSLSVEEFSVLIFQACHYCGSKSSLISTMKHINGDRVINHNGIDRVNNEVGYEINNCVPCCTTCNYAKRTESYEKFVNWINELVNFQNSRRENFVESVK
jgi:hypothetical protein